VLGRSLQIYPRANIWPRIVPLTLKRINRKNNRTFAVGFAVWLTVQLICSELEPLQEMLRAAFSLSVLVGVAYGDLRPEAELTHSCFNFPESSFHRTNCVKSSFGSSPHTAGGLSVGESAFDFTLKDIDGTSVSLSGLLSLGKPVLMVWGMWTCPAYQGLGTSAPFDQCSYKVTDFLNSFVLNIFILPKIHFVSPGRVGLGRAVQRQRHVPSSCGS
jgi:hypothetical protein